MLVTLFIILGIMTFIKQMPKLIDDLLGEDSGLGKTVRDKFKESGGFALGAAAGALGVGAARGIKNTVNKGKELKEKRKQFKEQKGKLKAAKANLRDYKARHDGKTDKALEDQLAAAKNAKFDARREKRRASRGMLGAFAGIGAGALSSSLRSISANTNGFGFDAWKQEFKAMGGNIKSATEGADMARGRRDDRSKRRHDNTDAKTALKRYGYSSIEDAKAGLDEMKKKRTELESSKSTVDADVASIKQQIDAQTRSKADISAKIADNAGKLTAAQANAASIQAEYDEAMRLASSGDAYQKGRAEGIKVRLDAANASVASLQADQTALQTQLSGIDASLPNLETQLSEKVKVQTKLDAEIKAVDVSGLEKAISDVEIAHDSLASIQKIQEIKASIVAVVNPDATTQLKALQGIQDQLEATMKAAESNAESIATKFGDKIVVDAMSSLKKSSILFDGDKLTAAGSVLSQAFGGKDTKSIGMLSSEIKDCTDPEKLKTILKASGVNDSDIPTDSVGLQALLSQLKTGLSSFDGAYSKEVKKQIVDACSSGGMGIFTDKTLSDPLFSEVKKNASVAAETFRSANLPEIFGTSSFGDSKSRKDAMDKLSEKISDIAEANAIREARSNIASIKNPKEKK